MTHKAKVVIVGGGIIGSSIAYHLTKMGWTDIMLLDKGALPENDGSSSHAPGGVGAINHSKLMTQFAQYATKLYSELPDYPHVSSIYSKRPQSEMTRRVFNDVGGLELARSQERWEDMKRLHSAAQSFGVETRLLTPKQTQDIWPIINPDAFKGALLCPSSSLVSGMGATGSMAAEAVKTGGCSIHEHTGVIDVEIKNNRVTAVLTDNPNMPRIECEHMVLAIDNSIDDVSDDHNCNKFMVPYWYNKLNVKAIHGAFKSVLRLVPAHKDIRTDKTYRSGNTYIYI